MSLSVNTPNDMRRLLEAIVHGSAEPVFVKDLDGRFLAANLAAATALQVASPDRLIGQRDTALLTAHEAQAIRSSDLLVQQLNAPVSVEERYVGRPYLCRKIPWLNADGRVIGLVVTMHDLSERQRNAARIQHNEELLGLAQEAGRLGVFEWQVQSGVVSVSPQFLSLYGLTAFDSRYESWRECVYREDLPRITDQFENAFATGAVELQVEFRINNRSDAGRKWMESRNTIFYDQGARAVRVVGVHVDVTERKRSAAQLRAFTEVLEERVRERTRELEEENEARKRVEESLRQAQKMEAVGQLTGGVAHDFNNLLTVVLGGLDSISRQLPTLGSSAAVDRMRRSTEMALQGVRRAVALTNRLLAFSRQQPLTPRPLDANKLVGGISELLRRTLSEVVALETVLAGGLWRTFADSNQLENAIVNLAVNARDAMPHGGKVTIETGNCYLDEAYVASLAEPVASGQYVLIAIADSGLGMDEATVNRAFEPFFTTKDIGKGTGLGLSQVYGFVRQSSGHVKIYSEVGEGTTVKIYLPRYIGEDEKFAEPMVPVQTSGAIGKETVLVVEDDEALRSYTTDTLTELGYRVICAHDGAAGLLLLERESHVDLLFTDVVMAGMNGRQLAEEAVRRRPGLKVLFTSGYTRNAIVHHGRLDPGVHMISKPFSFDALAAKVRALLDQT